MTVTCCVAEPEELLTVSVKVVEASGFTFTEPFKSTGVPLMDAVVPLVLVHLSVDDLPAVTHVGVAVKLVIVGAAEVTVTITCPVAEPEELLTISV